MSQLVSSSRPTVDQRRALDAWESIVRFSISRGEPRSYGDNAKEYAREAKKLPARIITSGLGPSLAFILAKAKDKKPNLRQLHEDLTRWVLQKRPVPATNPQSLLESILQGDSAFLRRATDETLAYLQWLNRFAEAEGLIPDVEEP